MAILLEILLLCAVNVILQGTITVLLLWGDNEHHFVYYDILLKALVYSILYLYIVS